MLNKKASTIFIYKRAPSNLLKGREELILKDFWEQGDYSSRSSSIQHVIGYSLRLRYKFWNFPLLLPHLLFYFGRFWSSSPPRGLLALTTSRKGTPQLEKELFILISWRIVFALSTTIYRGTHTRRSTRRSKESSHTTSHSPQFMSLTVVLK